MCICFYQKREQKQVQPSSTKVYTSLSKKVCFLLLHRSKRRKGWKNSNHLIQNKTCWHLSYVLTSSKGALRPTNIPGLPLLSLVVLDKITLNLTHNLIQRISISPYKLYLDVVRILQLLPAMPWPLVCYRLSSPLWRYPRFLVYVCLYRLHVFFN